MGALLHQLVGSFVLDGSFEMQVKLDLAFAF